MKEKMDMNELKRLRLLVVTPDSQLVCKDNLIWVMASLIDGKIGIKANHAPLLAETVDGVVSFDDGEEIGSIEVQSGILMVGQNGVTIFTTGLIEQDPSSQNHESGQIGFDRLARYLIRQMENA